LSDTRLVGIAGGSGTGKTTIARHLVERFGGVHIDGDRVGHAVLGEAGVVRQLVEAFGPGVLDATGAVDRKRLGPLVFADSGRLEVLNAIVHPAVIRRCAQAVADARRNGEPLVVVDAALILEVDMQLAFDLVIALTGDPDVRVARIMAKGGWSEAEVRARLARQQGMEKHFYKADAVIDTGRDLSSVLTDIDARVAPLMETE
jgi:dephospho-CoA kinase